ncbi:MAG: hypothetical protein ACM3TR_17480 [Caulobacteraceae bacterium]
MGDVNIFLDNKEMYIQRVRAVAFVVGRVFGIDKTVVDYFNNKYIDRINKM